MAARSECRLRLWLNGTRTGMAFPEMVLPNTIPRCPALFQSHSSRSPSASSTFQPLTATSSDGSSNTNVIRTRKPRGAAAHFAERQLPDSSRGFPQAETREDAERDAHMFPVPTPPHAQRLPTPQSGTPYQRVGTNHSPSAGSGGPGVLGELTTASLSRVVPRCLSSPWAAPPDGTSALRGEDRGARGELRLTPAHPRSLTLTLGG
ncbi:hypothetical protein AB1E18_019612 [Capra hircus]